MMTPFLALVLYGDVHAETEMMGKPLLDLIGKDSRRGRRLGVEG